MGSGSHKQKTPFAVSTIFLGFRYSGVPIGCLSRFALLVSNHLSAKLLYVKGPTSLKCPYDGADAQTGLLSNTPMLTACAGIAEVFVLALGEAGVRTVKVTETRTQASKEANPRTHHGKWSTSFARLPANPGGPTQT